MMQMQEKISMTNTSPPKRAAVYARYSSDLQQDRSIEDQVLLCKTFAEKNGFRVTETFFDRARSGSSLFGRDGVLSLLEKARAKNFDVVIVEALDRLSRDQEDLAAIYKRMQFLGVDIVAVHDGRADAVQIGIRGLVSSLYLSDLANKVRRGLAGRVKDGLSAGGKAYGYSPVLGKPGELVINDAEADVVRRVFADFAGGKSPREIAHALNREEIAPPRGAVWNASTINGSATRTNGILRNSIYNGVLIWNRVRMVRDPDTGKRISRMNPETEWQRSDVPELRIVDADVFEVVQAKLEGRKARTGYTPRRPRMLSGLLRCGKCGGGMTLDGQTNGHARIRCARSQNSGTCDHRRKYPLAVVEEGVIDGLRQQLANPMALVVFVKEYFAERRRLAIEAANSRSRIENELAKRKGEIERLLDAYMKGLFSVEQLADRRPALDAEVARLEAELSEAPPLTATEIHPAAVGKYLKVVGELAQNLGDARNDPQSDLMNSFRELVDAVIVHPSPPHEAIELEIKGKLSALLGETIDLPPERRKMAKSLVAGEGLEPPTRGL